MGVDKFCECRIVQRMVRRCDSRQWAAVGTALVPGTAVFCALAAVSALPRTPNSSGLAMEAQNYNHTHLNQSSNSSSNQSDLELNFTHAKPGHETWAYKVAQQSVDTQAVAFGHADDAESKEAYFAELRRWRLDKHDNTGGQGELGVPADDIGAEIKRIQEEA